MYDYYDHFEHKWICWLWVIEGGVLGMSIKYIIVIVKVKFIFNYFVFINKIRLKLSSQHKSILI